MSSLLTNAAAQVALMSLASTNALLDETQSRISTGLEVVNAADNAAYWSIATTMRSDVGALSAVEDSLGLGAAILDVQTTAMESVVDVVKQIQERLITAQGEGVDRVKIQEDIGELQNQLKTISGSASFNSENWLAVDSSAADYSSIKRIVSAFTRDSTGAISVGSIDIDISSFILTDASASADGILDTKDATLNMSVLDLSVAALTDSAADKTTLTNITHFVDKQYNLLLTAATTLGAAQTRVHLQQTFTSELMDALDRGIGQLVDADMDAESTRLKALQTQQQLGIQALQIANNSTENILALFKN